MIGFIFRDFIYVTAFILILTYWLIDERLERNKNLVSLLDFLKKNIHFVLLIFGIMSAFVFPRDFESPHKKPQEDPLFSLLIVIITTSLILWIGMKIYKKYNRDDED